MPRAARSPARARAARHLAGRCGCSRLVSGPLADRLANRNAAHALLRQDHRDLYPQDPVFIGRARAIGVDVGAELDLAPEGTVLDLHLLVEAAGRVRAVPLTGEDEAATADFERHTTRVNAGQLSLDHYRGRRVTHVGDVYVRHEARLPDECGAPEDVSEELVDLAAHPLEI